MAERAAVWYMAHKARGSGRGDRPARWITLPEHKRPSAASIDDAAGDAVAWLVGEVNRCWSRRGWGGVPWESVKVRRWAGLGGFGAARRSIEGGARAVQGREACQVATVPLDVDGVELAAASLKAWATGGVESVDDSWSEARRGAVRWVWRALAGGAGAGVDHGPARIKAVRAARARARFVAGLVWGEDVASSARRAGFPTALAAVRAMAERGGWEAMRRAAAGQRGRGLLWRRLRASVRGAGKLAAFRVKLARAVPVPGQWVGLVAVPDAVREARAFRRAVEDVAEAASVAAVRASMAAGDARARAVEVDRWRSGGGLGAAGPGAVVVRVEALPVIPAALERARRRVARLEGAAGRAVRRRAAGRVFRLEREARERARASRAVRHASRLERFRVEGVARLEREAMEAAAWAVAAAREVVEVGAVGMLPGDGGHGARERAARAVGLVPAGESARVWSDRLDARGRAVATARQRRAVLSSVEARAADAFESAAKGWLKV